MAYVIEQQPSQAFLTSTLQPVIFTVSDVGFSGYKYRFALKIHDDASTQLTVLALQPNDNDAATFNIAQVLDSYVNTTNIQIPEDESSGSIHRLGIKSLSKMCAIGGFTIRQFLITLGYIKATTATGSVSFSTVSSGNKVFAIRWAGQTSDYSDWNLTECTDQVITNFSASDPSYETPFLSEIPQNGTDGWGSGKTNAASFLYKDNVTMLSYRTLATPTGEHTDFDLNRDLNNYHIRVMNGAVEVGIYNIVISSAGGVAAASVDSDSMTSFIGVGPMNLKSQTYNAALATAINATWTYYDVVAFSSTTVLAANQLSGLYRYTLVDTPCLYDQFTIGFNNRAGAFDYIDVLGSQTNKTNVRTRSKYYGKTGNYLNTSTSTDWARYGRNGGVKYRDVKSRRSITCTTGWYDESRDVLIESLIVSRNVVMIKQDGSVIPIIIKSTSYVEKTSLKNKLFSYDINFEFAKDRIS